MTDGILETPPQMAVTVEQCDSCGGTRDTCMGAIIHTDNCPVIAAHRLTQQSAATGWEVPSVEQHGDWLVWYQPWPIESREFDWHFARKGIRGDDGISTGNEGSREMCLQTIDFLNEEDAKEAEREASGENTKFVDSGMRTLNRALLYQALKQVMQLPGIRNLPGFATGTHLQSADYALAQYEDQTHD